MNKRHLFEFRYSTDASVFDMNLFQTNRLAVVIKAMFFEKIYIFNRDMLKIYRVYSKKGLQFNLTITDFVIIKLLSRYIQSKGIS